MVLKRINMTHKGYKMLLGLLLIVEALPITGGVCFWLSRDTFEHGHSLGWSFNTALFLIIALGIAIKWCFTGKWS